MNCAPIRPLLYRVVEGEASPEEAMQVARHVPACTACRILLAREQRLAQLLESDLGDLNVDEAFVESVMATLPDGPRPRKSRRGLKLAGLFGAVASSIALGGRGMIAPAAPDLQVPVLDGGFVERVVAGLAGLLQTLLMSADSAAGLGKQLLPGMAGVSGWLLVVLVTLWAAGAALVAASCGTAVAVLVENRRAS